MRIFAVDPSRRAPTPFSWKSAVLWGLLAAQVVIASWLGFVLIAAGEETVPYLWTAIAVIAGVLGLSLAATYTLSLSGRGERLRSEVLPLAFEELPHPRLIVGPGGETVVVNAAFEREFGAGPGAPLETLFARYGGEAATAQTMASLKIAAAAGFAERAEVHVGGAPGAAAAGTDEWHDVAVYPIFGRPGYVMWGVEDVTERRRMEQLLHHEQEALYEFVENAPVGFYSVDSHGRFLLVNRTLAEWLGTTPEEIMDGDYHLHDFVVSAIPKGTAPYDPSGAFLGEDTRSPRVSHYENVTFCGRQGRVLQVEISQNSYQGPEGELHSRSVVHDVTSERELEQALRRSMVRFQRFFDDAPGGIAQLDLDGRIIECNRALRRLLGGDDGADGNGSGGGDITGRKLTDLIAPAEREKIATLLADIASGSVMTAPVEVPLTPAAEEASGPGRVASFFASRLEDDSGEISGLILHGLDTTELKRLETQFAQSQKMQAMGQLAGGIAHDFNNLLTAMIGFCDLLLGRHRAGEQSFADVMQIKQNANRAANLVRQLLAFSRQQTVSPKILDVTEVLVELSHLMRRLLGETIALKITHGRDLGLVKVDQGQLEQVIVNLSVNARDAMAQGGTLTLRTENVAYAKPRRYDAEIIPAGDYVLIEVADTGQGIDKEHLERIFDPFFSTKEVGSGTGLGLSTVLGIVKQADGFIFVNSVVGKGTTFSIFLPRHWTEEGEAAADAREAPAAAAREAHAAAPDLTGAGTVLLVEDEDPVRLFSARALRNKGYKVLEARSGNTAIELITCTDDPIDLLITDIVMPDMDGPALIEWITRNRPQIKVICISGYAEESFRKRLDAASGIHFLAKPFDLNQLAGKVKEVLARVA